jgi:hypothetical protein
MTESTIGEEEGDRPSQHGGCPFSHQHPPTSRVSRINSVNVIGEGGVGCPFNQQSRRSSVVRFNSISHQGHLVEQADGDSHATCPFFTGAAEKNVATLKSRRQSVLLPAVVLEGVDFTEEDTIEFSYTKPSLEFPERIEESDLFSNSNSSSNGFFTREYGVLIPDYEAALQGLLRSSGRIWHTMGRRMAGLLASNSLVTAIDEMEIIEADEKACPDGSLQIACSMLASLTDGYRAACWRNNIKYEPAPALQIPFQRISERLFMSALKTCLIT